MVHWGFCFQSRSINENNTCHSEGGTTDESIRMHEILHYIQNN